MLYYEVKWRFHTTNEEQTTVGEWHVGEGKLSAQVDRVDARCVLIQADTDELERIHRYFPNLPTFIGKVVKWRGDFAQFIWDNLK